MALDTQEKRMNMVGVARPYLRSKLPGDKDQQWRVASGNAYGGNAVALPSVARDFVVVASNDRQRTGPMVMNGNSRPGAQVMGNSPLVGAEVI